VASALTFEEWLERADETHEPLRDVASQRRREITLRAPVVIAHDARIVQARPTPGPRLELHGGAELRADGVGVAGQQREPAVVLLARALEVEADLDGARLAVDGDLVVDGRIAEVHLEVARRLFHSCARQPRGTPAREAVAHVGQKHLDVAVVQEREDSEYRGEGGEAEEEGRDAHA